jgi:hypothetical protein
MGRGLLRVPAFHIPKQLVKHYDKHILMISSQQNKQILRVYGSAVALSVLEKRTLLSYIQRFCNVERKVQRTESCRPRSQT